MEQKRVDNIKDIMAGDMVVPEGLRRDETRAARHNIKIDTRRFESDMENSEKDPGTVNDMLRDIRNLTTTAVRSWTTR